MLTGAGAPCPAALPFCLPMPTPHPLPAGRPDVRALLDALQQRRARTLADRTLAAAVRQTLEGTAPTLVDGLHFYVFEGAISVYGAVGTYAERDEVLAALAALPGATHIADHLTVLS
jgi:hypothetical protein